MVMADPVLSEIKYLGNRNLDFIEVAVDAGADVSDLIVTIYLSDGTIRSTNAVSEVTPTTVAGKDVYVISTTSSSTFSGVALSNGVALSDDTGVFSFVSFANIPDPINAMEGPALGTSSDRIEDPAGAGESLELNPDTGEYEVQTDPNPGTVPCLTAGTRVRTCAGDMRIEDLRAGMRLPTHDGTEAELLSVLSRTLSRRDLAQNPRFCPVRIRAGALGAGLPQRDLLVSRQHRMLVRSPIVSRMFGVPEVLVAAIRLVGLPGIDLDPSVDTVTYVHLLFRRHEVIFAEGAPTESLFLGDQAVDALSAEDRAEIDAIFPGLLNDGAQSLPNCLIPGGRHQKKLVARHAANGKALFIARD